MPPDVQAQLDRDRELAANGRPKDTTHVEKVAEGRTANNNVWRNAEGSESLELSVYPINYQENGQARVVTAAALVVS